MSDSINDFLNPIKRVDELSPIEGLPESETIEKGVDSGLSSIEKSKNVVVTNDPAMNIPILIAPADQAVFAISTTVAVGRSYVQILSTVFSKIEEIKDDILKGWAQNLRAIEEQVRQTLSNPMYIQLQEIRVKGNPLQKAVSGIQGTSSAQSAASKTGAVPSVEAPDAIPLVSTLERMRVIEKIPPTAEVQDTTPPQEPSRALVLPLLAATMMGGALALGTVQATTSATGLSSNVLSDVVQLAEKLQPVMPEIAVANMIPVINLMIVGPIYYNSWQEATSNFKNNERQSNVETVNKFAQDVIKMVSDPTSILNMLVAQSGTKGLSQEAIDRQTRMLKLVIIGVALSLLYTLDVGKLIDGKFLGMEPEEVRDILLRRIPMRKDPNRKPTLQEELSESLLNRAGEQIELLRIEDRELAADILLGYVMEKREMHSMMDPLKVYQDTVESITFDPKHQQSEHQQSDLLKA